MKNTNIPSNEVEEKVQKPASKSPTVNTIRKGVTTAIAGLSLLTMSACAGGQDVDKKISGETIEKKTTDITSMTREEREARVIQLEAEIIELKTKKEWKEIGKRHKEIQALGLISIAESKRNTAAMKKEIVQNEKEIVQNEKEIVQNEKETAQNEKSNAKKIKKLAEINKANKQLEKIANAVRK